jgi:hypothetical protein
MPRVLFAGPVNATWAANHADHFLEKGIDGFLLQGLLDSCEQDIWANDGDPATTGRDDALLREVRIAHLRLKDQQLAHNFLSTSLPGWFRGFEDEQEADAVVAGISRAAEFCALAGLMGIALDTRSSDLLYHPLWDGYTGADFDALDRGARRLGRRLLEAFHARHPDGQLLLIFDGAVASGPLWPALFAGFVQAMDRLNLADVDVLSRSTVSATEPANLVQTQRVERGYLALHASGRGHPRWADRGVWAAGLRPLVQPIPGGEIYAAVPIAAYQAQLAAAKLISARYVWIESAGQTWWQVQPEEAAMYAHLHQGGPALAAQTKPIPAYLASVSANTPLDALRRVEAVSEKLTDPVTLAGDRGAAAVVWPGQSLALAGPERADAVIDLITGQTLRVDVSEGAVGPFGNPVLVHGLSIANRVIPASLWLDWDRQALDARAAQVPISFGFVNHTPFALEGVLNALAPRQWSIDPPRHPFLLEPGDGLAIRAGMRGPYEAGAAVALRAALVLPGAQPRTRQWDLRVPPRLRWYAALTGTVSGAPVWADMDHDARPDLLVTTSVGELVCLSEHGEVKWARVARGGFAFPPVVARAAAGWAAIAAVDMAGDLHVYRGDGEAVAQRGLGARPEHPLLAAELDQSPGDELLVLYPSGRIEARRLTGEVVWECETGQAKAHAAVISDGHAGAPLIACAAESMLVIDGLGQIVKTVPLSAPASCPPTRVDTGARGPEIYVGTRAGTVLRINDDAIEPVAGLSLDGPIRSLEVLRRAGGAAQNGGEVTGFLIADAAGIHLLDAAWQSRWSWPSPAAVAPVAIGAGPTLRILVSDSSTATVVCLGPEGVVQWTDDGALWGPVSPPAVMPGNGPIRYAYGSGERILYVREF